MFHPKPQTQKTCRNVSFDLSNHRQNISVDHSDILFASKTDDNMLLFIIRMMTAFHKQMENAT